MKTTVKIHKNDKMTNEEDSGATRNCNTRVAGVMAVQLVSQILDEAYVIANAARDSGQPWRHLSILKSFKTGRPGDTDDEDPSFEASKGDCDLNENKTEMDANVVATSTPQKRTIRVNCSDEGEASVPLSDTTFIGQGDEDLESQQNELANSTSMFINHLFDMSDLERIVICDDIEVVQSTSESNEFLAATMNKIMETYDTNTVIPLDTLPLVPNIKVIDGPEPAELSRSDNSDYSILADAFVADISRDVTFYIDDDVLCEKHDDYDKYDQPAVVEEIMDSSIQQLDENTENMIQKNDVALYENAYATLNRDYDQGSEEDGFPVLQDPKGMTLQEVELMTADTSDNELSYPEFNSEQKPKEFVPTVSGASGSRKSTLARRCRVQGARLLACLRGWWRRKTPGKRKDSRYPGLGMCPLSPDARRRASSLMDNRLLRSPSPSRSSVWKFNTVNEAVVSNSNHWKEYTFDAKPEDCVCGEY